MTRIGYIALALAILVPTGAWGQQSPLSAELQSGERRLALLTAHQGRLEKQLADHTRRVGRLKRQPRSVGRDLQLQGALRSSQKLAKKLTTLRGTLRKQRSHLLSLYEQAIDGATTDGLRAQYRKRRQELREAHRSGNSRIVSRVRISPLDGPAELDEKADLLADSAAKLRRQAKALSRRIKQLQRRSRLRRHARAATDNPFVEDATRRLAGKRGATARAALAPNKGNAPPTTTQDPGKSSPAPSSKYGDGRFENNGNEAPNSDDKGALDSDGTRSGPGSSGGEGSSGGAQPSTPGVAPSLRRVLDPATLSALAKAGKGRPLQRLAALKKAQAKLRALATQLSQRANTLRSKAKGLRKKK